jgi:beta-lactamase class D
MKRLVPFVLMSFIANAGTDLAPYFKGLNGTFVLYNSATRTYIRYNEARAAQRFSPCSTYKIPNSLIALETGVVPDAEFVIPYDANRDPRQPGWPSEWPRDHTLRSAFQFSVVWYYQEVARRIGMERMTRFVRQFQYGNQDVSAAIDRFWLGSSMRISADEQVAFLESFRHQRLNISTRTTDIVKEIMVADRGPGWVLRAKTGACRDDRAEGVVWYVGIIEKQDNTFYFAMNLGGPDLSALTPLRIAKAREILAALDVLGATK